MEHTYYLLTKTHSSFLHVGLHAEIVGMGAREKHSVQH